MCCGPSLLSSFTFLHGPHHTYWPGRSFYEVGISSRGPSFGGATHTHKLHMQGLGIIHGSGRICLLQSSLLAVLYTRCHGVGGVFQLWGKGLKGAHFNKIKFILIMLYDTSVHNWSFFERANFLNQQIPTFRNQHRSVKCVMYATGT